LDVFSSLAAPVGTLEDKLRLAALAAGIRKASLSDLFESPDVNVINKLKYQGYSSKFIKRFINPFLSSITLDPHTDVSWRFFLFVLAMFASGDVALPADGMGEIPRMLAADLPETLIHTGCPVIAVSPGNATVADGRQWTGRAVVVATDEKSHFRLFQMRGNRRSMPATCVYYSASLPPLRRPFLVLNADENGPIRSVVVPSLAASNYSPPGAHLVAVTSLSKTRPQWHELSAGIERQLGRWYGGQVQEWRELGAYFIPHGLPDVAPPLLSPYRQPVRMEKGMYLCGEAMGVPSIQWALYSGRRAAEAVLADIKGVPDGSVTA
jgi:phytoene dehydrogenase-like protein